MIAVALLPGHRGWFDVGVYHGAINYWMHEGGQIYNYVRTDSVYGFTYPPFAAICMLPMAMVAWHPTIALHLALTVAASVFLLWLLVGPIVRREGWPRAYAFGMAVCLFAVLGPVRDTFLFGQINLLLMALVYLDLMLLTGRHHRFAGIGIGLAAAIKLTPGIFLIYLLITRRWRAALVATVTALAATVVAAIVAPDATRTYFTELLWDTSRIGVLDYVSNQSLMGMVSRLGAGGSAVWPCVVLLVMFIWGYRVRRATVQTGFALTGVVACLVSPITWVHHLVWLVPGLILLADNKPTRRLAIAMHVLLVSCLVWVWSLDYTGVVGFLGSNAYVLVSLAMLGALPAAVPAPVPALAPAPALRPAWLALPAWLAVPRLGLGQLAPLGPMTGSRLRLRPVRAVWADEAVSTSRFVHPASHLVASAANHPAAQGWPTIQVLASGHARHLR